MIKKRNLDNSLIQWIMTQTGLGPGIGDIRYLVPAVSSTSQYRTQLQSMGVTNGDMFTTLAAAENVLTANRNDVLLIMPGSYTQTTELAWDKDHTHILGLGGPNNAGDHSLSGVTIYMATAQIVETIDITADRCVFQNLLVGNGGNHATNVGAVNVDGWGNYFKNVAFIGSIATNQNTAAAAASLLIDRLGHFPIFEDCIIGQNNWGVRSGANSGVLRFVGTTAPAPQNGTFRRCQFISRSDTNTCAMIALPASTCIDRPWLFEDCMFHNYSPNNATAMNKVIYEACATTYSIILKNCVASGFTEWQTGDKGHAWIGTDVANAGTAGGIVANPTSD